MASNCPPVREFSFDFGPASFVGHPPAADGITEGYCPRRKVLDKILVDAAPRSESKEGSERSHSSAPATPQTSSVNPLDVDGHLWEMRDITKTPILGQGITDAFRDAELLAEAIDAGFSEHQPLSKALAGYEQRRNTAVMPPCMS